MKKFELVIAGGRLAAARAIKSFRESGGRGPIVLLSKESDLPPLAQAASRQAALFAVSQPQPTKAALGVANILANRQ